MREKDKWAERDKDGIETFLKIKQQKNRNSLKRNSKI